MSGSVNAGDTAWILTSALLVMLMTPGLALFYGGLVRGKNVLSTLMQSFFILALISVQWVLWGYSLAFGSDRYGLIGGLEWFALLGVGGAPNKDYAATIPHLAFMAFQMMFAIITPALITGAFAERKRFKAFALFTLLWATLVYDPIAHWVWGVGGWLRELGALDFAGGTVVHISSGISALVAALVMGPRAELSEDSTLGGHNLTITALGAALLWFGWFGFNAGSALTSGALAASAFVATNTAAAMAGLAWMTIGWMLHGRPSVIGLCTGAIAGLVAITPAFSASNLNPIIRPRRRRANGRPWNPRAKRSDSPRTWSRKPGASTRSRTAAAAAHPNSAPPNVETWAKGWRLIVSWSAAVITVAVMG